MSFSSRNHDLVAHRSALGARQRGISVARVGPREPAQPVGGYDLVHAECEEGGGAECDRQRRRPSLGQVPRVTYRLEAARRWHILWRGDSLSSCSGIEVLREGGPGGGRVRGGRKSGGLHGRPRRQAARANVRLAGHGSACRVRRKSCGPLFSRCSGCPPVKISCKTLFITFKYTPQTPPNRPG